MDGRGGGGGGGGTRPGRGARPLPAKIFGSFFYITLLEDQAFPRIDRTKAQTRLADQNLVDSTWSVGGMFLVFV